MFRSLAARVVVPKSAPTPPPLRPCFITRSRPSEVCNTTNIALSKTTRESVSVTDISARPISWTFEKYAPLRASTGVVAALNAMLRAASHQEAPVSSYGDTARSQQEQLTTRWGKVHFGNVFHAPRNYVGGSRWYRRRYSMKKHRYKKRWRTRRFKLAALANLPHYRMIRISMLPDLKKQSKGKGNAPGVDGIADLVSAAFEGSSKAQRGRPYSKYQE